ncbi:MAG: hypothetical protein QOG48_1444 [Verrucomicrobiota bacterium]|jgi:hypothetical protein
MPDNEVKVREPWPDEMFRAQHMLRTPFLFDSAPFLLVAASGRVERFIGVLALTERPLQHLQASWLNMRVLAQQEVVGQELLQRGMDEAWRRDSRTVYFAQTVKDDSPMADGLRAAGFKSNAVHEVYELDARALFARIDRIYQRLQTRNSLPTDVELTTLQRSIVPKVRKFLRDNLPGSASTLAHETAGYKAEHSVALLQNDEVKGVVLGRRRGNVAHTGLRVVAKELRGGSGWVNLLMMHATLASGMETGLEMARFEFDPELHHDTQQFAALHGGRLVMRRSLFRAENPAKKELTEVTSQG